MDEQIIYYAENPGLRFKTVTDVSGNTEYRKNVKKIRGDYYTMGKDCFLIDGQWYRKSLLIFDEEKKVMIVKSAKNNLLYGVVGIEKGGHTLGHFSPNPYNNVMVQLPNGETVPALNSDFLIENGYTENFSTGLWQYTSNNALIKKLQTPLNVVDHKNKGYNIEDNAAEFLQKILLFNEYKPEMSKDVRAYGRMLGDTTWGVELEAAKGFLPEHIQNRTGVVICRDGSLKDDNGMQGPEYVTVPQSGARFLQNLLTLAKEGGKRNTIDINCSYHLHAGNLPTSRIFLVTLFKLCLKIQNELFLMFPFYKTNPTGVKNKNYNQKLPTLGIFTLNEERESFESTINKSYKKMFNWLTEGYQPCSDYNRKNRKHPVQAKWDRHKRYFWMNLMNAFFSNRNTVEFRLHGPTFNAQKMINWVFICNAIIKYAMNNSRKILTTKEPITLANVLDHYKTKFPKRGEFLSEYLKAYVEERKATFLRDIEKGDRISKHDIDDDKDYLFKYGNVTYLF